MKGGEVSLYVIAPDSDSPQNLQKTILKYVKCTLDSPCFRMNDSSFALFWWDLLVQNVTTFRNQTKKFQHEHPYMSVFIMDHSIPRSYKKCC